MIKCNKCGTQNKDGSRFCSNCGNDLNSNVNNNVNNTNNKSSEKVLFCILAFFFPIIGIIVGCIYSKDKKEVFITGTIKNLGPKVNNVYVFVPCYDSKGGTIPDADAHIGTIGAGETWNFSAEAMATNGLTIGSCDLKRIKVRGF